MGVYCCLCLLVFAVQLLGHRLHDALQMVFAVVLRENDYVLQLAEGFVLHEA